MAFRGWIFVAVTMGFLTGSLAVARSFEKGPALEALYDICFGSDRGKNTEEVEFLAENAGAMTKMMAGMTVGPQGDTDRDFVLMMVAHHQGAIEMAQTQLRYGSSERLKRISQEIIVTQQQEIAAMQLSLRQEMSSASP